MLDRLSFLSYRYARRMDVLSDVMTAMRAGRPHSSRTHNEGHWELSFGPFVGAGFHIVLQGACWLAPDGGEPLSLGVGDVVFLPHGRGHDLSDSPSTRSSGTRSTALPPGFAADQSTSDSGPAGTMLLCGAYLFDQGRLHPLLADLPEVIHLRARVGLHQSMRAAIDLLGTELETPRPGADAIVPALLDTLLLYILRAWFDEQSQHHVTSGWAAALTDSAVGAALRGIHRDPGHPWTVQTLGAQAGLSRAPFARRFTELVGQPPLTYLTWWRMTVAARLIRDSDLPLRAVAERAGYASEFAFAKAFKREYGLAPGGYRTRQAAPK
jgi:AraC-like DNA-binding protein